MRRNGKQKNSKYKPELSKNIHILKNDFRNESIFCQSISIMPTKVCKPLGHLLFGFIFVLGRELAHLVVDQVRL